MKTTCLQKKGLQNFQNNSEMEIQAEAILAIEEAQLQQLRNGSLSSSEFRKPEALPRRYRYGLFRLHLIFGLLQVESAICQDDLPTSFVSVEREIAKYISECLPDVSARNQSTAKILKLVRLYKVVEFQKKKELSISLMQLYLLLDDNFQSSSLCKLLNLFLFGSGKAEPKVIAFK